MLLINCSRRKEYASPMPSTTVVLPTTFLAPQEHLILCNTADEAALSQYGRNRWRLSALPTLNSTGDSLRLTDAYGREIFAITYSDDWYNDAEKKSGGWSLEMVDTRRPCGEQDNWAASVDPDGGTPGRENAVQQANPDRFGPKVLSAVAVSDTGCARSVRRTAGYGIRPFRQRVLKRWPDCPNHTLATQGSHRAVNASALYGAPLLRAY